MKRPDNIQFANELISIIDEATAFALQLRKLDLEQLNFKKSPEQWSALECIEHLNLYGNFYLPEIEARMLAQKNIATPHPFKSGIIGNYFANLMMVKNGKIKKMKTPQDKNPANSALTITTIERFLKQQERLKALLVKAKNIDLTKTKVSISISKYVKLRLGDTFRFLIYHINRHMRQAENALKK